MYKCKQNKNSNRSIKKEKNKVNDAESSTTKNVPSDNVSSSNVQKTPKKCSTKKPKHQCGNSPIPSRRSGDIKPNNASSKPLNDFKGTTQNLEKNNSSGISNSRSSTKQDIAKNKKAPSSAKKQNTADDSPLKANNTHTCSEEKNCLLEIAEDVAGRPPKFAKAPEGMKDLLVKTKNKAESKEDFIKEETDEKKKSKTTKRPPKFTKFTDALLTLFGNQSSTVNKDNTKTKTTNTKTASMEDFSAKKNIFLTKSNN